MKNNPHHLRWPPERFYWALLDTSVLTSAKRQRSTRSLDYLFEPFLPIPLEEIHTTHIPLDNNRSLACGVERSVLANEIGPDAHRLTPQSLPPFLQDEKVNPETINLLTGPFEPNVVRTARLRWAVQFAAIVIACTIVLIIGLERRAVAMAHEREAFDQAQSSVYSRVLGTMMTEGSQPLSLQLMAELRRLRLTHEPAGIDIHSSESSAAETLNTLLNTWPRDVHIQTESILISPNSMTMICVLSTAQQAESFARKLDAPHGWRARQPEISSVRNGVRLTVRFEHQEELNEGESG